MGGIKIKEYECYEELYFCPSRNHTMYDEKWMEHFLLYLSESEDTIGRYIDIQNQPQIIFLDSYHTNLMKESLSLYSWITSITIGSQIIFFSDYLDKDNQKDILNHEMFHARLYQYHDEKKLIPTWFNESIAYYIGNNIDYDGYSLLLYLEQNLENVKMWMIEDTILKQSRYCYDIIKSFGNYFCSTYTPCLIKDFLFDLKNTEQFNLSASIVLQNEMQGLIDNWYQYLIEKNSNGLINQNT